MFEVNNDNTLYVTDREEWRMWLEANFQVKKEIWLIYPNKASGKERIPYNDAVEEALCFGWIDSTIKPFDEYHSVQRYTPRRARSPFSQTNIERLRWLVGQNKIHPSLEKSINEIVSKEYVFPEDIIQIIKSDDEVWKNYQRFPDTYKRIRIAYIHDARIRPEEFQKRLAHFIRKTRENKMISGFGGVDKHYYNS